MPVALDAEIRSRCAAFADELAGMVVRCAVDAACQALDGVGAPGRASRPIATVANGHARRAPRSNGQGGDEVRRAVATAPASAPVAPASEHPAAIPLSLAAYERSAILRALAKSGGNVLAAAQLMGESRSALYRHIRALGIPRGVPEPGSYLVIAGPPTLETYERAALERAMVEAGGSRLRAAKLLGIGKSTMYRKLEQYGIMT
jgi:DNA-binding NtrC family response regulator